MNIMTLAVIAVIVLFAVWGWKKGMIGKLSGVLSLVLASLLVTSLLPMITNTLKTATPVYGIIETQCRNAMDHQIQKLIGGGEEANGETVDRDQIRYILDQYGYDSSIVDSYSDEELKGYIQQYFPDYYSSLTQASTENLNELTRIEQTKLIRQLPVPQFLQDLILNYNNEQGYAKLGVERFGDYLVSFLADIILNIAAFLLTLLVTHLIIWAILAGLKVFDHIPFLHGINHAGGLVVGALQGVLVVWLLMLILSAMSGTSVGGDILQMVNKDTIMKPIYESNLFLKEVTEAISKIM